MKEYTRKNSLRLQGYDYSRPGYYFITICAKNGEVFFGEIRNEQMMLSDQGTAAMHELQKTAEMTNIGLDCLTVMPNHVHFIAVITENNHTAMPRAQQAIPAMVQSYKAAVSRAIGFSPWHRSFYDEILKTRGGLEHVRNYIKNNPASWGTDKLNPRTFDEYLRKHPL